MTITESDLENIDPGGNTPLCAAAEAGSDEKVCTLLEKGAAPNAINSTGKTALHLAVMRGFTSIVYKLLDYGASPFSPDLSGDTPIDIAMQRNEGEIVNLLLHYIKNSTTSEQNSYPNIPFASVTFREHSVISAVRKGKIKFVRKAIEAGSSLEEQDSDGNTALCVAAQLGLEPIVSILLIHGACVEAKNHDGSTALHLAALGGFTSIVQKLLIRNASPYARDANDLTPLDLASLGKHKKVQKLLKDKLYHQEPINSEEIFRMERNIAYIKKQRYLFFVAERRAMRRRFCQIQERRIYHAARNYKIRLKKERERKKIYRNRTRRRAGVMKRMCTVEPTNQNPTQRKIEHAVERAIKSGGRRAAYNAGKRAEQREMLRLAALKKKHQVVGVTRGKKKQKQNKKKESMMPPSLGNVRSKTEQSHRTFIPPTVQQKTSANLVKTPPSKQKTKKTFRSMMNSSTHWTAPTFEYKSVISQETIQDVGVACIGNFKTLKNNKKAIRKKEKNNERKSLSISNGAIEDVSAQLEQSPEVASSVEQKTATSASSVKTPPSKQKTKITLKSMIYGSIHCPAPTFVHKPVISLETKQGAGVACIDNLTTLKNNKAVRKKEENNEQKSLVIPNSASGDVSAQLEQSPEVTSSVEQKTATSVYSVKTSTSKQKTEKTFRSLIYRSTRCTAPTFIHKPVISLESKQGDDVACIHNNFKTLKNNKKSARKEEETNERKSSVTPNGASEDVSAQLQQSPEVPSIDKNDTSVHIAAGQKNERQLTLLLKAGANVDPREKDGRTPLHEAVRKGRTQCVRALIQYGANVDAKENIYGSTPLHLAALTCKNKCLEALIEGGADILQVDARGQTPLHISAWNGHAVCIDTLIAHGTPVDIRCKRTERVALHFAAVNGHLECISILLKKGSVVDSRDRQGRTALHVAAQRGHHRCMQLLVEGGANVQSADKFMNTALHLAAEGNHEEAVKLLVDAGASCSVKNNMGKTPLDVAGDRVRSHLCI